MKNTFSINTQNLTAPTLYDAFGIKPERAADIVSIVRLQIDDINHVKTLAGVAIKVAPLMQTDEELFYAAVIAFNEMYRFIQHPLGNVYNKQNPTA